MRIRIHGWQAFVLLAVSWPLSALEPSSHIALPGGDELWLTVPTAWDQKFESPKENMPPSVWLTPRQGPSFNVIISPLSGSAIGAAMSDDNKMRAIVTS